MGAKKTDPVAVENQKRVLNVFLTRFRQAKWDSGKMQKEIAKEVGTSEGCISRWMNGAALPETVYLPALANALGVSVDWLFGLDETDWRFVRRDRDRLAKLEMTLGVIKLAVIDAEIDDVAEEENQV